MALIQRVDPVDGSGEPPQPFPEETLFQTGSNGSSGGVQ